MFSLPPLRLELPECAYAAVSACWWSRERWIAHHLALYDQYYALLRRNGMVESVSRKTFEHYLIAESSGADYSTGRNARLTVAALQRATLRSESTMHRCRRLLAAFGGRTVVFRGRHRTRAERLDSWRRDDPCRGWSAVAALHESTTLPVDNSQVQNILHQGFGTPPGQSPGSLSLSRPRPVTDSQNMKEGRAPRGQDKRRVRRKPRSYDPRAVVLAARVRADERNPVWLRLLGPQGLSAVLTSRAIAGWQADDVHAALDEVYLSGRRIFDRPRDPYAYLAYLLSATPVDEPPMLLDRARETAIELERLERQRVENATRRAEAMATVPAAPNSAAIVRAREIAAAATRRGISTKAAARVAAAAELRDLAQRARQE
ncbi:MAG TPA: hypothetical protein VM493_12985 [Vicinamibacterales bacterium]|nr:hypothetical protein [Vicinamibacterales bacterium]